jgi:hypothetical protein
MEMDVGFGWLRIIPKYEAFGHGEGNFIIRLQWISSAEGLKRTISLGCGTV